MLGRLIDRVRHRMRRTEALRMLHDMSPPDAVLFVCHGNICRSPFAEAVFRREVARPPASEIVAGSAGFVSPNRPPPPPALAVAREFGIDMSGHRSRVLTQSLVASVGLVVVMSPRQVRGIRPPIGMPAPPIVVLGDLDPAAVTSREIRDPVKEPPEVYRAVYERIERCVKVLVSAVTPNA